jgi:carbamoyltransferase
MKATYVLGTGLSHDGSACLLKDGRIQVAIEKERLSRLKHDGHNDSAAIAYCLDAAGITLDDVTLIVQNANFGMLERGHTWWRGPRVLPPDAPVITGARLQRDWHLPVRRDGCARDRRLRQRLR